MATETYHSDLLLTLIQDARAKALPVTEAMHVSCGGVFLEACITPAFELNVSVDVKSTFNQAVRDELYQMLEADSGLVAGLLLWEWPRVCVLCDHAAREAFGPARAESSSVNRPGENEAPRGNRYGEMGALTHNA